MICRTGVQDHLKIRLAALVALPFKNSGWLLHLRAYALARVCGSDTNVERGEGEPLVLLHGNGSMIQDFKSSGLIDMAAAEYRVIAFDRPGHGHSDRPRTAQV